MSEVQQLPGSRICPTTRIALLERIQQTDDHEAWKNFVDLYGPLVYQFCRQRGLQDADSRDIIQNVFARISRSIGRFEYDRTRGRFRSWVGTITVREIARWLLRNRRPDSAASGATKVSQLTHQLHAAWVDESHAYVYSVALRRVREDVSSDVWAAFELTWINDEKPQDVAEQLGRPVAWIYKAKFRVLQRLRVEVDLISADLVVLL